MFGNRSGILQYTSLKSPPSHSSGYTLICTNLSKCYRNNYELYWPYQLDRKCSVNVRVWFSIPASSPHARSPRTIPGIPYSVQPNPGSYYRNNYTSYPAPWNTKFSGSRYPYTPEYWVFLAVDFNIQGYFPKDKTRRGGCLVGIRNRNEMWSGSISISSLIPSKPVWYRRAFAHNIHFSYFCKTLEVQSVQPVGFHSQYHISRSDSHR